MEWVDYTPHTARGALRAWIGEATSDADSADAIEDYRLDLIIETAQRRDMDPALIRLWIYDRQAHDRPGHEWTPLNLVDWACRRGYTPTLPEDIDRAMDAAKHLARQLRSLSNA